MMPEWEYWSRRLDDDLRSGKLWDLIDIDIHFLMDSMLEAGL